MEPFPFLDDATSRNLATLIRQAAEAGATDILFAPGARVGKLMIRSGGETLLSRVVESPVIRRFSEEAAAFGQLADLRFESGAPLESALGSFEVAADDPIHVRVIATPTPVGTVVRLRLQLDSQLARALQQFREGLYGGRDIVPFLHSREGVVLVAGPVSSGKTSALHHVAAELPGGVAGILSEAREFDPRGAACPSLATRRTLGERLACTADLGPGAVVVDEMDDADKLDLALALGATRLVLASVVAPNLETALRRAQASLVRQRGAGAQGSAGPPPRGCPGAPGSPAGSGSAAPPRADRPLPRLPLIGVLRVGWVATRGESLRRPCYAWFPFERHRAGVCACCGDPGVRDGGPCGRCGNRRSREELGLVPENVVRDVESLESFRAGARLVDPIEGAGAAGPGTSLPSPGSIAILDQKGGGWTWPISPGRN